MASLEANPTQILVKLQAFSGTVADFTAMCII